LTHLEHNNISFLFLDLVGSRMMGFLQPNPSMMSNRREQTQTNVQVILHV